MRHITVFVLVLVACTWVLVQALGQTGEPLPGSVGVVELKAGRDVPSFMPWNVTGPHAGKAACPLCVYSQRPSAAVWTGVDGLPQAVRIAAELDRTIEALRPRTAVGYVVLLPEKSAARADSERTLRAAFARTQLRHVFLTIADRAGNEEDVREYAPAAAPGAVTTTILYVNRTAASVHHNLGAAGGPLADLRPGLERLFADEEPYKEIAVAMCPDDEPGERLEFYGRVLDEQGSPLPKASVIAYNTDAAGLYVPRGSAGRTPRISGVAVTNADGWYRFRTVRPGGYPDPQHIHLHIDAAVHRHTYRTLWFEDDPRVTPAKRRPLDRETVIVPLRRRADGVWTTRLDVRLEGS